MMRYVCFRGVDYEASGGLNDCIGLADSEDEAKAMAESDTPLGWDWAEILDTKTGTFIRKRYTGKWKERRLLNPEL